MANYFDGNYFDGNYFDGNYFDGNCAHLLDKYWQNYN
jgi:hypothetical protein